MSSRQMAEDMENLLDMEIKLRLLETEGITIPTEAPPIPELPDNFNFVYMNSWINLKIKSLLLCDRRRIIPLEVVPILEL